MSQIPVEARLLCVSADKTRKACVIAAAATSRDTIIHKSDSAPVLGVRPNAKGGRKAREEEISSAADSPENCINSERLQKCFVQLTPISLKPLII
jgi:hypothetical protein